MRDMILQLLPEFGVPGVPGVPQGVTPQKPYVFTKGGYGTPCRGAGVPGVPRPARTPETAHPEHPAQNEVFQEKVNQINGGTPSTPGTPEIVQDFIDDIEERAAILQFDASDLYKTRAAAWEAAYLETKNRWKGKL